MHVLHICLEGHKATKTMRDLLAGKTKMEGDIQVIAWYFGLYLHTHGYLYDERRRRIVQARRGFY